MNKSHTNLKNYFTKCVKCYEEVYYKSKPGNLRYFINRLSRLPMNVTFKHTMHYLSTILCPQNVIDIGAGVGIYSVNLARQGVVVTAIDMCEAMIDATEAAIEKYDLRHQIKTVLADFIPWSLKTRHRYDLALAIGIMDYTPNAREWLISFRRVSRDVIITFPAKSLVSIAVHIKYRVHGIRGYTYTRKEIEELLSSTGMEIVNLSKLFPGGYWVHARCIFDNPNIPVDSCDG